VVVLQGEDLSLVDRKFPTPLGGFDLQMWSSIGISWDFGIYSAGVCLPFAFAGMEVGSK